MPDGFDFELPEDLLLISEYPHEVDGFSCGSEPLDEFINDQALEFSERQLGETWLLCEDDEIVAFYTLAPASVPDGSYSGDETPEFERLEDIRYPIPALLIARFGVVESRHGEGIGTELVDYIIAWASHQELPFWFITLDAKEDAIEFYKRLNFVTSGEADEGEGNTEMFYPLAPRIEERID